MVACFWVEERSLSFWEFGMELMHWRDVSGWILECQHLEKT